MKHLMISAVSLLLFSSYGFGQANESSKEESNQRNREVDLKNLDQRKNYHWANGTTSTPSGREAAPASIEGAYMSHKKVEASIRIPAYRRSLAGNTKSYLQTLDQRKIYHWKDGTTSTPAGHEATPTGGGYASLGGNSDDRPLASGRDRTGGNQPDQ